jgi:thiol-disulfide isomerase/thioredoxin
VRANSQRSEETGPVRAQTVWHILGIGAVIVLLGAACLPVGREGGSAASLDGVQPTPTRGIARIGAPAPVFELADLEGNKVKLSDLHGQMVLLNFWATWCGYCRAEFPLLQAFHERHQDEGFVVLAINIQENKDRVAALVSEMGLTLPVLLDWRGDVTASYRVRGLPASFLVDREGIVIEKHVGPLTESILGEYLAQSETQ